MSSAPTPSKKRPVKLPLLAVRDVAVFPHMMLPLSVGRAKSIKALEAAMKESDKLLAVVAQKDVQLEDPQPADLFTTGVLVEVVQFLKMPDGTLKVFLQGLTRIVTKGPEFSAEKGFWEAELEYPEAAAPVTAELKALMRHALEVFEEHAKVSRRTGGETLANLARLEDPSQLADILAAHGLSKTIERQAVLEIAAPEARLESSLCCSRPISRSWPSSASSILGSRRRSRRPRRSIT